MKRELDASARHGGYGRIVELIGRSYERDGAKTHHRRRAAMLFRHLREAGIIQVIPHAVQGRAAVRLADDLQRDFSLHHTLSLYLLDALNRLDPEHEDYALDVVTLVESILEHPRAVLLRQVDKIKGDLVARLKAEGVEYEQRMEQLDRVEHPKPNVEFIYGTFDAFRAKHPWVATENIRPKSVARDMYERFAGFNEYVNMYGLGRSEGVLLRYLTQAYKTLVQSVPDFFKNEALEDICAYLRAMLARVDSSLVAEWERMVAGKTEDGALDSQQAEVPYDPAADRRSFIARLRAEMHSLVKALAAGDYEEAAVATRSSPDEPWTAERMEEAVAPCIEECGSVVFGPAARVAHLTNLEQVASRRWIVRQTLVSREGETPWMLEAEVDLTRSSDDGPLSMLLRVAS
jgi:hypothetical protein